MVKTREPIQTTEKAIKRGLDFIYRTANKPGGFASYGSLIICCFALVGATSRDAGLRQLAKSRAQKLTRRWKRLHPVVPLDANADLILDFAMLRYALGRIGERDIAPASKYAQRSGAFQCRISWVSIPPPSHLRMICRSRAIAG